MLKLGKLSLGKRPVIAVPFADGISPRAIAAARRHGMDVAELRVDRFASVEASHLLKEAAKFKGLPVIVTVRSKKEGGARRLSDAVRLKIFETLLPHVSAVDIELSSPAILQAVVKAARRERKTVIVSYHNFRRTPPVADLRRIVGRARRAGADIVKIAARAASPKDVEALAGFTASERRGLISIAMGPEAALSRVIFPSLGSLVTYASFGKATAPGQMDLQTTARLLWSLRGA